MMTSATLRSDLLKCSKLFWIFSSVFMRIPRAVWNVTEIRNPRDSWEYAENILPEVVGAQRCKIRMIVFFRQNMTDV